MARLTVLVEGETPRTFQLGTGRLSIGSGEDAKLTLAGSTLAELHADLEVGKDSAVLRLRQGVPAAMVDGREVTGEWTLVHGQAVDLGRVCLTMEYDGAEESSLVQRRNVTTRGEAARKGKAAAAGGAARKSSAGGRAAGGSGRVQRSRPRASAQRSMPTWAILLIVAVVLGGGYAAFQGYADSVSEGGYNSASSRARVEKYMQESDLLSAEAEIDRVLAREGLTPDDTSWFEGARTQVAERRRQAELRVENQLGSKFLESAIASYERKYLTDDKSSPRVRVLLKRIDIFQKRWPEHPEQDFVQRLEDRYGALASLSDPVTLADVEWEVKTLTWTSPRDYETALDLIRDFAAGAGDLDKEVADALLAEKKKEELEYAEDRLQQARFLWEKDEAEQRGKAVEWLVQLVTKLEDPDYIAKAETALLNIPDLESRLRGYQQGRQEIWGRLMQSKRVRERAATYGL